MILGIGTDICDISRIEKFIDKYGQRFLDKTFTTHSRIIARVSLAKQPIMLSVSQPKKLSRKHLQHRHQERYLGRM